MHQFDPSVDKSGLFSTQFFSNSPATHAHDDLVKILEDRKQDNKITDLEVKKEECTYEFTTVADEEDICDEPVLVKI